MSTIYNIKYPEYVSWRLDLSGKKNVSDCFSTKTLKKIKATFAKLEVNKYKFIINKLDKMQLVEFEKIYREHINKKRNPVYIDILNQFTDFTNLYILKLSLEDVMVGALIFRKNIDNLSAIYKYFPFEMESKLPISTTYLAEYKFFEHAMDQKCRYIKHGKDKNVYGVNTDIGLARFKLQIGCVPIISKGVNMILERFDWDCESDVLIFEGIDDILIANLFLVDPDQGLSDSYKSIVTNEILKTKIITI
jgi:hypothetical protein